MSRPVLVCFAVSQEARPFLRRIRQQPDITIVVTGMGERNARRVVEKQLARSLPHRVFTCGFAGALTPELRVGDIVYDSDETALASALEARGARRVRFHTSARIVVTVEEKAECHRATQAEVVEMESAAIRELCAQRNIPCTIVRAISDTADEQLPFDFNTLLTPHLKLSYARLLLAILRAPGNIRGLLRLGKNSARASEALGQVLLQII